MKRWNIPISKEEIVKLQVVGHTQKEMAEILKVSIWRIERRIKLYNLQKYSNVRYDLMDVTNPIFCYLLGWFCTDGYLNKDNRMSLRCYDEEVITKLSEYFGAKKYTIVRGTKPLNYDMCFSNAPEIFRCFTDKKSYTVYMPLIPTKNIDMFLRGVIEGDGCIRLPGTQKSSLIRIFSASSIFIEQLQSQIEILGFSSKVRRDRMGWELSTGSLDFCKFIYSRYTDYVCLRKYERVQKWLSI